MPRPASAAPLAMAAHGGVRRFLAVVAAQTSRRRQAGFGQQVVEQHARSGAFGAVDIAHAGQRPDRPGVQSLKRVVFGHDQALLAVRKADQLVQAGFQQAA